MENVDWNSDVGGLWLMWGWTDGCRPGETTGANGLKITRLFHYKGATL